MRINISPILSVSTPDDPGIEVDFVPIPYWAPLEPEPPNPDVFCECRLPKRESPVCVRNRAWQVLSLRRQAQPGGQLFLHHQPGARQAHTGAHGAGGGGGGSGDDGGGGGPPCSICGQASCSTPYFCNLCRLFDAGRLVFLFGGRR